MSEDARDEVAPSGLPLPSRVAIWIGGTLGRLKRRWSDRRDDAYIREWKSAWRQGWEAQGRGMPEVQIPYRRRAAREAWLAGWHWAKNHPGQRPEP